MCGRYNILPNARAWLDGFKILRDLTEDSFWQPRYNIPPSSMVPIIRTSAGGDSLVMDAALWGFVPHWVRDERPKLQPANARADNVAKSGYFRESYKNRRCLFVASGFYEWQATLQGKQPYNITTKDGSPLLMGGLWDEWRGEERACIITTDANELMQPIHNRMPVIIDVEQAKEWILGSSPDELLKPHSSEGMKAYRVSTAINKPQNDGPNLLEEIE